ncbi:hypothetical protein [Bacillus sp. ISL-75]|nr:hypothetical protein [Bacillus sp. ISL-75]
MFSQEEREVIYDVIYKRRDVRTFLPDPVSFMRNGEIQERKFIRE